MSVHEIQPPLNPAPSTVGKQVLDLPCMRQNRICRAPHRGAIALHEWSESGASTSRSSNESPLTLFLPVAKLPPRINQNPLNPFHSPILKPRSPAPQIHTLNPFTQTAYPFIVIPSLVGPWLQLSHDGSEGHPTWTPGRRSQPKEN